MEIYLTRTAHGLSAADDAGKQLLRRIKLSDWVLCKITRPRNIAYHRRFFAMLNFVWASCGDWNDVQELLDELKFHIGHVDRQKVVDRQTGEVLAEIVKPKSIAFHAMGQDEFQSFVDRAIDTICTKMVPGIEDHVLRDEILRAVA